jgi:hypothetical protein
MSLILDGSNGVTYPTGAFNNGLVSGTAVTATGTFVDFSDIPAWAKRISVMFSSVSTNGSSSLLIQVGSGGITSTGYISSAGYATTAGAARTTATAGFAQATMSATSTISGISVINHFSGNTYVNSGVLDNTGGTTVNLCSGTVTLTGVVDRIRITTVNGTDIFDAGTINIMYE